MPCLSDGYDERDERDYYDSQREQLKRDKAQLEAALCTALTFIENAAALVIMSPKPTGKKLGLLQNKCVPGGKITKRKIVSAVKKKKLNLMLQKLDKQQSI